MRKSWLSLPLLAVAAVSTWFLMQKPQDALAQATAAGFTPCASGITISATSVTSNSQLNTCGATVVVWNTGSADAFLNWGTLSTTAATTSGWALPAGTSITLNSGRAALYLAAITSSGSATLRVVQGNGGTAIAGGTSSGGNSLVADPCSANTPTYTPINIGSATTTRIISPTAAKKTYICSIDLFAFAADNIAIVEGTGGTCGAATAGVVGGTTTATGISFPAQGGLAKGSGTAAVWATAGTNVDFCLITSTTGPLTGHVKWVQQ